MMCWIKSEIFQKKKKKLFSKQKIVSTCLILMPHVHIATRLTPSSRPIRSGNVVSLDKSTNDRTTKVDYSISKYVILMTPN